MKASVFLLVVLATFVPSEQSELFAFYLLSFTGLQFYIYNVKIVSMMVFSR